MALREKKRAKQKPKKKPASKSVQHRKKPKPRIAPRSPARSKKSAAITIPKDFKIALEGSGALAAFEALTDAKQRSLIKQVESAKRMESRLDRIERIASEIKFGGYYGFRTST